MLPYDKYWLSKEQHMIEKAIKYTKEKRKDNKIMIQWLCIMFLLIVASLSSSEDMCSCPHCAQPIEVEVKKGEWECPKCQYKNDNRIRYCGMCGAERQ